RRYVATTGRSGRTRRAGSPRSPPGARRLEPIGGAEQRRQPQVDQIDARHPEQHLAGEDDSLGQDVVDHVEERRVGAFDERGAGAALALRWAHSAAETLANL